MQVRTRFALLALAAGAALLVGAAVQSPAGAAPGDAPVSGDPRATAHAGNATTCAQAGLAGEDVTDQLDVTITAGTYITINSVPDNITLTGIVVKGGDAYNVYPGTALTDLHAPLVSSGKPAGISHWFACGVETTTTGPTPSPTPSKSETQSPSTSPATSSSVAGETTSPAAAPVPPSGGGLANTGSPISAIAGLGALLVLAGAAMLILPVARRRWVASRS